MSMTSSNRRHRFRLSSPLLGGVRSVFAEHVSQGFYVNMGI